MLNQNRCSLAKQEYTNSHSAGIREILLNSNTCVLPHHEYMSLCRTGLQVSLFSKNTCALVEKEFAYLCSTHTSIIDENGICRDPNAETIVRGEEITCKCIGAFVSSNGGKTQGALDSCVPCSSSPSCAFEGDKCFVVSECVWDSCVDGRCANFEVSYYKLQH